MPSINTCLWYDTGAEEAVNLYTSLFKDVKVLKTARYSEDSHMPKGTVMTIEFEMFGQRFTALNGGPIFKFTEAISVQVVVDTQEETDRYWKGLTENGGEEGPCGWCKDKFGLSWQVVPRRVIELLANPATAERANAAMMKMKKLDIAIMEKAAA